MAQAIPIHITRFPSSYTYLQGALPGVSTKPAIWAPFLASSNLTEAEGIDATRWGSSPWVFASPLASSQWAQFNEANPGRIEVSSEVLTRFEANSNDVDAQTFLLAKVLHELCHWGCFRKHVAEIDEVGEQFERAAFGEHLHPWWLAAEGDVPASLGTATADPRVFSDPNVRAATCRQLLAGTANVPGRSEDPSHTTFGGVDVSEPLPRGIRNNNPGNLRRSSDAWLGLARLDQMRSFQRSETAFFVFREPEWGMRAMISLLRTYKREHGLVTPRGIIGRYAPASDNNNVESYATVLASGLDIGVDDVVDAGDNDTVIRMIKAMIRHENGTKILYSEAQYRTALELL